MPKDKLNVQLTFGLLLMTGLRLLALAAVCGLGVEGGWGTGDENREASSSSYGLFGRGWGTLLPLVILPTMYLILGIWSEERLSWSKCMLRVVERRGGGGGTER